MAKQQTTGTTLAPDATHGAGHGKVFPPLDPTTFAPQLIWLALTFGLLYLIMSRVALPKIGGVIEERRDRIQRDLDEAERLKTETEKALANYEQALSEAKTKASAIAQKNRNALGAEVEAERARVEAQIAAKLVDADARINATKAKALASVKEIAADTAGPIVAKLIGTDVSADEVKQALMAAAAE